MASSVADRYLQELAASARTISTALDAFRGVIDRLVASVRRVEALVREREAMLANISFADTTR